MEDGQYIHYQTWNKDYPVALKFRFTEIAFSLEALLRLRDEIDTAINQLKK